MRNFSIVLAIASIFCLVASKSLAVDSPVASTNKSVVAKDEPKAPGDLYTNSAKMELVKISDGLWAGKFEVTQKEYEKVAAANPSQFRGPTFPVDSVTWMEAVDFCTRMTDQDIQAAALPKGFYYTLPTEDEWKTLMANAEPKDAVSSVRQAFRSGPNQVGSLAPNSLGLYDVRGNVMEFVLSDTTKPFRFLKGGSWRDSTEVNLRPEFRWYCKPDERKDTFGFRCLLKAGAPPKP